MTSDTHAAPNLRRSGFYHSLAARVASKAEFGSLHLTFPDGPPLLCEGNLHGPAAEIRIHSWRILWRLWARGDLGFAEAYMAGECDTAGLRTLMDWALVNQDGLSSTLERGPALYAARLLHGLRPNTRDGSRRNIRHHYDLSNAFYESWLDPSMTYSSAMFDGHHGLPLNQAQEMKYARIAEMAELSAQDKVLEIGCGWGGFAQWAAREIGCGITAVTISQAQYMYAKTRIHEAGLDDRIDLQLKDYRDVTGTYDKIVSIEMIEAVGEKFWPVFGAVLRERLRPGGRAVLQAITMDEDGFEAYRKRADFIQVHVFPGGMLPTVSAIDSLARASGLQSGDRVMFGADYAETLRRWRCTFEASWPEIEALGFDERFRRMWRYYLAYCEAGFDAGRIDVGLFALDRP